MALSCAPVYFPRNLEYPLQLVRSYEDWLPGEHLGLASDMVVCWDCLEPPRLCSFKRGPHGWIRSEGTLELSGEGQGMLLVDGSASQGVFVGAGAVVIVLYERCVDFLPFGARLSSSIELHAGVIEVAALRRIFQLLSGTFEVVPMFQQVYALTLVTDRMASFMTIRRYLTGSAEPPSGPFVSVLYDVALHLYRCLSGEVFEVALESVKIIDLGAAGIHTNRHRWCPVNVDLFSRWALGFDESRTSHVELSGFTDFRVLGRRLSCRETVLCSGSCLVFSLRRDGD